jgi:hypothetical protein
MDIAGIVAWSTMDGGTRTAMGLRASCLGKLRLKAKFLAHLGLLPKSKCRLMKHANRHPRSGP